jgi:uncharacterized membrane protein
MDLELQFNAQIEDIQRRLRDCNFQFNRLKDLVANSLPELIRSRDDAESALRSRQAEIERLQAALDRLQQGHAPSADASLAPPPVVQADLPAPVVEPVAPPVEPAPEHRPAPQPQAEATNAPAPAAPASQPEPQATRRDGLEDFIGGNILNKVGIGILIIGIGIFVKYAIDQDWIGPIGRVLIGLLSGSILLGVAHKLREHYKAFSSVLLGGGIAVMYFSVAIAFHQYQLLSQPVAFGLMCGITAATVVFSLAYNRQEIAVLALLGAFSTPFLVAKGEGNYVVLFSYILLVNVGMLVLAWFRDWRLVRMLGYFLTVLLFAGWVAYSYGQGEVPMGALVFAMLFFATFFMTILAFRVRKQQVADLFTYASLLSNSVFFYGVSMLVLQQHGNGMYMGAFTAAMAAFHFAFILPLRRLLKVNDHVQTMLVGLVLSFATLAIPIQLSGHYITLFWIAEAVLVLFLAQRTGLRLLRVGSAVVSALAVTMLARHWELAYGNGTAPETPFLNGVFLTSMLAATGIVVLQVMRTRYAQAHSDGDGDRVAAQVYQFVALPLYYLGVVFELGSKLAAVSVGATIIGVAAFTAAYLGGMLIWAKRSRQTGFGGVVVTLSLITALAWVCMQPGFLMEMCENYRAGYESAQAFPWHLLSFGLVGILTAMSFLYMKQQVGLSSDFGKVLVWGFSLLVLALLSLELEHLLALVGVAAPITRKVGYPILWGLMGFGLIAWGMREKLVTLRLAGLVLFLLILLKLFLFDIRDVSPTGKILAFISLGVLLLVVSFMYQRLRKLLRNEPASEAEASR